MPFTRNPSPRWHDEVPGARWFKADLHVHTIDDRAGGRAKMPREVTGDPTDPVVLKQYARAFLKGVVRAGIEVVALTPHAVRVGETADTCAVWHIVDEWNAGMDDDGVAFRDKVYAVFPGFEPSLNVGSNGLHLIFIFDPEIGRETYLDAFSLVMGGAKAWGEKGLQLSARSASEAFDELRMLKARRSEEDWGYAVLAPHCDRDKGLFGAQKSQALALFEHGELIGLEIGDNKLPEEVIRAKGEWFEDGLRRYRHALYHASDAYKVSIADDPKEFEVGHRFTWLKLANPRIEAIRQAFLANDSRLRIAYKRVEDTEELVLRDDPPEPVPASRPWIRSVTIEGESAFFGGRNEAGPIKSRFDFSPDLTCIIGGSMSGKSTLLDGLRTELGQSMPTEPKLKEQVSRRAENFLSGSAKVGRDLRWDSEVTTEQRFPARFFTQGELQRLTQDDAAVQELVVRLSPQVATDYDRAKAAMNEAIAEGVKYAKILKGLRESLATASQNLKRAEDAKAALEAFSEAGLEQLSNASLGVGEHESLVGQLKEAERRLGLLVEVLTSLDQLGDGSDAYRAALAAAGHEEFRPAARIVQLRTDAERMSQDLSALASQADAVLPGLKGLAQNVRAEVERRLSELGYPSEKLREFKALQSTAAQVESYRAATQQLEQRVENARLVLLEARSRAHEQLEAMRSIIRNVGSAIQADTGGRVRLHHVGAHSPLLDTFIRELKLPGVTRWWNQQDEANRMLTARRLDSALGAQTLGTLGMSETVATSFKEAMSEDRRDQLAAIADEDVYRIELRVDADGQDFRPLDELSGGQRVNVLLTLLFESAEHGPLIIDQPEDELDNRFLFDSVLPALRRLKGRRQVIVATHNANIVVNGDADYVIQLEADARHGRVACAGAIEDSNVKTAIVETVDGGRQAFDLRKAKYGF